MGRILVVVVVGSLGGAAWADHRRYRGPPAYHGNCPGERKGGAFEPHTRMARVVTRRDIAGTPTAVTAVAVTENRRPSSRPGHLRRRPGGRWNGRRRPVKGSTEGGVA